MSLRKSFVALGFMMSAVVAFASYGLIQVDSPFAQTEIVNQRNVASARGNANAITQAGSTFVVRFNNGNNTYTYALYRKVYAYGSVQYFRISDTVTTGINDPQPNISIDPDLEDEADEILNELGHMGAIGDDERTNDMNDFSNQPLSTTLTFPPGAIVVVNGNGAPIGIVTCEPACSGSF